MLQSILLQITKIQLKQLPVFLKAVQSLQRLTLQATNHTSLLILVFRMKRVILWLASHPKNLHSFMMLISAMIFLTHMVQTQFPLLTTVFQNLTHFRISQKTAGFTFLFLQTRNQIVANLSTIHLP